MLLDHIAVLDRRITELDRKIRDRALTDDDADASRNCCLTMLPVRPANRCYPARSMA
jgi:hypothetical protein